MALSGGRLSNVAYSTIYEKLKELQEPKIPPDADSSQRTDIDQQWQDIAEAVSGCMVDIIEEIVANAQVTASVTVTSVSGVLAGGGVSGPGTGTATGTIS